MPPPILIIHDRPQDFRQALENAFPEQRFVYATTPDEIPPALAANAPQIVFSIKQAGFPGATHRPVLAHPSVRWVQVGGSGFEHFVPWDAERVTVTNAVGVLAPYLAETLMGALLALNSGLLRYADQQRRGVWRPRPFRPLCEQTLLVVGVGSIGGIVARHAKALGMRVMGIRQHPRPAPAVDEMLPPEALADVIGRADVVSLHVRVTPATVDLFDAAMLNAMKPGALLLNTSRGLVIDETALAEALATGHLGGAYLDVFKQEPLPAGSPLWDLPNLLITPHAADNVINWPAKFAAFFAANLTRWLNGETPLNVVSP